MDTSEQEIFNLYHTDTTMHPRDIFPMQYGQQQCRSGYGFGPAIRNYYFFHYIYDGCGTFTVNGKTYNLHKGQMFIIYPGQLTYYQADSKNPWFYRWIEFSGNFTETILTAAGFDDDVQILDDYGNNEIGNALKDIINVGEVGFETLMSYFWRFIAKLSRDNALKITSQNSQHYITKATNYIKSNIYRRITIPEIAEYLGINRSYLSTLFKEHLGISTQQFIIDLRLKTSTQFLQDKNLSVKEIALSVGYSNQLDFAKAFKAKFKMTPTEWRNQFFWEQSIEK